MRLDPLTRRSLLVAALVILAVAGALSLEAALTVRPDRPFGHTRVGRAMGWLGTACLALVFVYSWRKRAGAGRPWPQRAFTLHMVAGTGSGAVLLIHSGAHFHALVPVLALLTLGLIILSGIVGQAVHALSLRLLHDRHRALATRGLSEAEIEARLHAEAAREQAFRFWQYLHAPVTVLFLMLAGLHIAGALYFGGP